MESGRRADGCKAGVCGEGNSENATDRGEVVSELHIRLYSKGSVTVQMLGDFDELYAKYMSKR